MAQLEGLRAAFIDMKISCSKPSGLIAASSFSIYATPHPLLFASNSCNPCSWIQQDIPNPKTSPVRYTSTLASSSISIAPKIPHSEGMIYISPTSFLPVSETFRLCAMISGSSVSLFVRLSSPSQKAFFTDCWLEQQVAPQGACCYILATVA